MSEPISREFLIALVAATPDRVAAAFAALQGVPLDPRATPRGSQHQPAESSGRVPPEIPPFSENATPGADDRPLLMTVKDAARRLGVARNTVGRAIRAGRLKKVEVYAGSYRLRRADVEALAMGIR